MNQKNNSFNFFLSFFFVALVTLVSTVALVPSGYAASLEDLANPSVAGDSITGNAVSDKTIEACSIYDTDSCSINEKGELTMDPLATAAFISHVEDAVCIVYFYSDTCSHCKAIKPLIDELEAEYGDKIHLTRYNVADPENIKLYNKVCAASGYKGGAIPLIGINDKVFVGEDQIRENLEKEIIRGMSLEKKTCPISEEMGCHLSESNRTSVDNSSDSIIPGPVLPVVIGAGFADGINPCAFVMLVFVMVFLQKISGSKKRLLKVTTTYIVALFITNLLLGILYYSLSIQMGFPNIIKYSVIIVSIIAGLINIKDFFWYGKGVSLGIPKSTKKYLMSLVNKASVSASAILGISVAVLEAPCSVPIYLAVIEVLKSEGATLMGVFPYMLIYNFMFIVPLIIISFAVYYGFSADYLEKQSLKAKKWMKLGLGLILLGLAVALLLGWL